ncbi:MAG: hypothetical protein IT204_22530 [Fimbriimonadaceae bacterium]|nr:hypothetical protein [Fimbriimonadaceae bacterium]
MAESAPHPDFDRLSALLDGELTATEQAAVEQALAADAGLRAELARLAAVQRLTHRAINNLPLPAGLFGRLQTALDATPAPRPGGPPRARPVRRARRSWLAGLAAVAAVAVWALLSHGGRTDPPGAHPQVAQLELDPAHLELTHAAWQAKFAHTASSESPQQMAAGLTASLGYPVRPPDLAALDAGLRGCATCNHSVPGRDVAVFVMRDRAGRPLTLYELRAPAGQVRLAGFAPTRRPGYQSAQRGGLTYLTWAEGDLRVCLVAADRSLDELLPLAPAALRVALRRGPPAEPSADGRRSPDGWA